MSRINELQTKPNRRMLQRRVLCAVTSATLAVGLLAPAPAYADTSQEVRAEAQREEVTQLEQRIDELANESIVLQGVLIEDRDYLSKVIATTYRWGGLPSILQVALSSNTVDDFISQLYYANKVTEWQSNSVRQTLDDKQALEQQMNEIDKARDERKEVLAQLDQTRANLTASINALYERAATLEAEERAAEEARLAEIARQAEAEKKRAEEEKARTDAAEQARKQAEEAKRKQEGEAEQQSRQEEEQQKQQEQQSQEEQRQEEQRQEEQRQEEQEERKEEQREERQEEQREETHQEESSSSEGDWIECLASAYTIADNTPPGSTATASGIPLDESVPTVALPASINPARFYGSKIQIEYGGMTVIATITDCGGLSGGARGLDLTPAVFRAFGYSTADAWGVRSVRYRFL